MVDRIRIGIFDEHPLFRQGVTQTIERNPGMVVVAEGCNAHDACKSAAQTELDILLIDICIRGGGLEATRAILAARAGVRVIILTGSDEDEHLSEAIRAGAKGYILKGVSGIELLRAIDMIYKGEPYVTPSLASRVLMQTKVEPLLARNTDAAEKKRIDLTRREQQVLDHIKQGLTNMEIAAKLGVSIPTIKHNIADLFRKIRVRNRIEAVHVAQILKLV